MATSIDGLLRCFLDIAQGREDPRLLTALANVLQPPTGLAGSVSVAQRSIEARLLLTLIWRAQPDPITVWSPLFPLGTVLVSTEDLQTRTATGAAVDFRARQLVGDLLVALAKRRIAGAAPMPVEDIQGALWPGERMLPAAGRNRVFQILNRLKKAGFADVISNQGGDGYYIDAPVALLPIGVRK